MDRLHHEIGIIQVLLQRFERQRLARARSLETKVRTGAMLNEFDLAFLEAAAEDAHEMATLLGRHPEYRHLVHQVLSLYRGIVDKALENETLL